MGITYRITNSAHEHGFDNMAVTPALVEAQSARIGSAVKTENSWGSGSILVGQLGTSTVSFSGGFEYEITLVYSSETNGTITSLQVSNGATGEVLASSEGAVAFTPSTYAVALQPSNAFAGDDHIIGNAYNNILSGYGGNDRIEGGGGIDTVVLSGFSSQYQILKSGGAISTIGLDGSDTLVNISRLQFDDKSIAYDTSGNAGIAYRLYQSAFDRAPDSTGIGFWMSRMDAGATITDIAAGFMQSAEFLATYGASPTAASMVGRFYQNILHRAPDDGGLDYWVGILESNAATGASVLAAFSESPENEAQVIGSIQDGISFTPFG